MSKFEIVVVIIDLFFLFVFIRVKIKQRRLERLKKADQDLRYWRLKRGMRA